MNIQGIPAISRAVECTKQAIYLSNYFLWNCVSVTENTAVEPCHLTENLGRKERRTSAKIHNLVTLLDERPLHVQYE